MEVLQRIRDLLDGGLEFVTARHGVFAEMTSEDRAALVHSHFHREFLVVLQGESRFVVSNRCMLLHPGCVLPLEAGISHSYFYRETDRNLCHLWLCFLDRELCAFPAVLDDQGNQLIQTSTHVFPPPVESLVTYRWNMLEKQDSPDLATVRAHLELPVRMLLEELVLRRANLETLPASPAKLVEKVKLHIRSRNGRGCSLGELEKVCGYSQWHLSHRFKEVTGQSIGEYINEVRRNYALELLKSGCRQKEVAAALGFASAASFWKWWRQNR